MRAYKSSKIAGSVFIQLSSFHKEKIASILHISSLIKIILNIVKQAIWGHNEGTNLINQGKYLKIISTWT